MWLWIPSISRLEMHPFTVSEGSALGETLNHAAVPITTAACASGAAHDIPGHEVRCWTHHIKASERRRWTRALYNLARDHDGNRVGGTPRLVVRVLGPFGGHGRGVAAISQGADGIVLVAGGLGITPISSLLVDLLDHIQISAEQAEPSPPHAAQNSQSLGAAHTEALLSLVSERTDHSPVVCLVWVVRHAALIAEFVPLLERLTGRGSRLVIHLTHPSARAQLAPGTTVSSSLEMLNAIPPVLRECVALGRPDVFGLLPALIRTVPPRMHARQPSIRVYSCGPAALISSVNGAASSISREADVTTQALSFDL